MLQRAWVALICAPKQGAGILPSALLLGTVRPSKILPLIEELGVRSVVTAGALPRGTELVGLRPGQLVGLPAHDAWH